MTFPSEERLADTDYATVLYKEVVRRVLAFGVSVPTSSNSRHNLCSDYNMLLLRVSSFGSYQDFGKRMPKCWTTGFRWRMYYLPSLIPELNV